MDECVSSSSAASEVSKQREVRLFERENEVLRTILDADLPEEESERRKVLETFHNLGRVFLYSLIQKQPVPSAIATPLLLSGLMDVDIIRGDTLLQLSEEELVSETLRSSVGLDWLVEGLRPDVIERTGPEIDNDGDQRKTTLASLSYGGIDDDEAITPTNRLEKLRAALGHILIDQRREILAALAGGFTLNGQAAAVRDSFQLFSHRERRQIVSGNEHISPEVFCNILQPVFPEEDVDIDAEDEEDMEANIELNLELFTRIIQSDDFAPHLTGLLRFITGCPSIVDKDMRVKVQFVCGQPTTAVPRAHTCFQTIDLSCERYESEDHLASLLEICAEHSTSFGAN